MMKDLFPDEVDRGVFQYYRAQCWPLLFSPSFEWHGVTMDGGPLGFPLFFFAPTSTVVTPAGTAVFSFFPSLPFLRWQKEDVGIDLERQDPLSLPLTGGQVGSAAVSFPPPPPLSVEQTDESMHPR